MLKTKKIIAISVLAVMSVCSLMSCSDKSSRSSQNYSVLVTEATTESLDNSGLDNNDPDNIGSGNNTSDNDALAGLPCRADVEAIFESWDISTPELVLAWQYPQEYLEVLANNDPDEFQSLYEEASELSTEQTKRTAQYEEEFSAPITYETTATGYEKLESEDLKFVEENFGRMYESIGLEPPKVTDGYEVFCNMKVKSGSETVDELEEGAIEIYLVGDSWVVYY